MQAGLFADAPVVPPALTVADPDAWPVQPGWRPLLQRFWAGPEGRHLLDYLRQRLADRAVIYPPEPLRALALTAPEDIRVVVLGQDPYHGPGQAEGLAFSVAPGVKLPPSLRNMLQELRRDLGVPEPADGSLVRWARQGVLLLNTVLTVEQASPGSHAGRGWEALTDAIIGHCSDGGPDKVFMLWGSHAQKKTGLIASRHAVLSANHPSPLSARRGPAPFLGCGHFRQANDWLRAQGAAPIDW